MPRLTRTLPGRRAWVGARVALAAVVEVVSGKALDDGSSEVLDVGSSVGLDDASGVGHGEADGSGDPVGPSETLAVAEGAAVADEVSTDPAGAAGDPVGAGLTAGRQSDPRAGEGDTDDRAGGSGGPADPDGSVDAARPVSATRSTRIHAPMSADHGR
jgi:hypothetical protein